MGTLTKLIGGGDHSNQLIADEGDFWPGTKHRYNSRLVHFLVKLGVRTPDLHWHKGSLYRWMGTTNE